MLKIGIPKKTKITYTDTAIKKYRPINANREQKIRAGTCDPAKQESQAGDSPFDHRIRRNINRLHRYSARAAAKRRERLRKNPALRESASERAWCATIGPANTQRGRPPQSRIPRQRVILARRRIGGRKDLAAFAAMAGETILDHQWPLNPKGKNSEYFARSMIGCG